ncbi:MAG: OmcA/MtrC family decaheme c-type cytochrome [Pseudomonadales bacterium]|nr:OmcA/MtrC family decaheme c-type cytochrome [Pseudomonadales bacterium]
MVTNTRNWIMAGMIGLLVACGGGGGGNSAPGVEPGPAPPGQPIPPDPIPPAPSANPYAEATVLNAYINSATLNGDNQPVIKFQLSDENNVAITDLTVDDVRFVVSKLETSTQGSMTGNWQSYINVIALPEYGTGTVPQLQATYERSGEFSNDGDGFYTYQYATSLTDLPQDILDQAAVEGLNLSYNPNLTHRVAIQFDNAPGKANPSYDWVPASGATEGIFNMDIAATANCNRCHDPLAVHGDGRREVKYCVTCHNPGSVDPDSTNTVDFKVMVHKIHMGANLPSVQEGEPYEIYGFRGSLHDYSHVHFPQDIRNCVNCHAGSATGTGLKYPDGTDYDVTLTSNGDNWSIYASQAACGSCHDAVNFSKHAGGQPDDSKCDSCHSQGGVAGSIQSSHEILSNEARQRFAASIMAVTNTAPGQFPQVQYKVFDPTAGNAPYDLQSDPVWTAVADGSSRLAIDLAWDTTDYTNSGNQEHEASAVSIDALTGTPVGDGSYIVTSAVAIPNGSERPFIAANGSGVAGIEGHPAVNIGSDAEPNMQRIPFTNANAFFSINEADGQAVPRRTSVELNSCLNCHQTLVLHGNNRTDNVQVCVACHNPRNTDREVREALANAGRLPPPSDGKDEESIDFKTMIHGIHAAGIRQDPLQIVGFGGFSVHVYDEEEVQYPGRLGNCTSCHTSDGYTLPLPSGVLATTIDTGVDHESPIDDTVVSPVTAVCSSCHDGDEAASHMVFFGGSFDTSQEAIDDGEVVEQCSTCHGSGRPDDVSLVHPVGD